MRDISEGDWKIQAVENSLSKNEFVDFEIQILIFVQSLDEEQQMSDLRFR